MLKGSCALVIVPHPDDEINLAGATIRRLTKNNVEVHVLYTTNGNLFGLGTERKQEAISSLELLGVANENIKILDYCDQHRAAGITHMYQSERIHLMEQDITNEILDILPNLIICIDLDAHPDHIMTSLTFERVLGRILNSHENYHPLVYKGFGYDTAYNAKYDLYKWHFKTTVEPPVSRKTGHMANQLYKWENRVCVPVMTECSTIDLNTNLIAQCLKKHATQNAIAHAPQIINADQVFWKRKTLSLSYHAIVDVTSGNGSFLNDFLYFDIVDIMARKRQYKSLCWIPDDEDDKKEAIFHFHKKHNIKYISMYENMDQTQNVNSIIVLFSNGTKIRFNDIKHNGEETLLEFPLQTDIEWVSIRIIDKVGTHAGFCEIEIYSDMPKKKLFIKSMYNNEYLFFAPLDLDIDELSNKISVYEHYDNGERKLLKENEFRIDRTQNGNYRIVEVNDDRYYDDIHIINKSAIQLNIMRLSRYIKGQLIEHVVWFLKTKFKLYISYLKAIFRIMIHHISSK